MNAHRSELSALEDDLEKFAQNNPKDITDNLFCEMYLELYTKMFNSARDHKSMLNDLNTLKNSREKVILEFQEIGKHITRA